MSHTHVSDTLPVPPELKEILEDGENIAVITHVAPDGDAIGSMLGLVHLLRERGKVATPVCQDPAPYQVNWLPGVHEIQHVIPPDVDLLVSIDLSDVDRMGEPYDREAFGHLTLVNIDHHATNTLFGTVNWVEPRAVAACEMVYHMAQAFDWPMSTRVATYVLTGLLTDTRGLRTANVNARVLRVVTHLVELGAPIGEITELTFNRKPLSLIKLWALALPHLHVEPEGIIWTVITEAMRRESGHMEENDGGLVSFIASAEGMYVGVVFTEKEGTRVNISLRSRPGVDVSQVAFALGGGGHPQAAGATVEGTLDEVIPRVLQLLRESVRQQVGG
ncbi:MAG: bifunctional oligoribonuclease/PAP phosphatase NrnA [Chloroflexi bacterium]|nr:bifunctional oligoribonuclease/PAP phosphatase NrnA [Chloroflexota bacterium]